MVNLLVTLLQSLKASEEETQDEYQYSDSDSDSDSYDDYDDEYTDEDDDSEWEEYEFEDSPLKSLSEVKVAKQLLLSLNEPFEQHQLSGQQLMTFLNTI